MFDITIVNVLEKSRTCESLDLIGSGAFSRVYGLTLNGNTKVAIKSIQYNQYQSQSEIQKNLKNAIFEFCLSKLFSCLEIGPQLSDCFKIDLIIYNNAVEFAM